jgi:hypothetical protein
MAHGNGTASDHHAADDHGHGSEPKFDIIAEGSPQDKLLVCAALAALLLLVVFAINMTTAHLPEPQQEQSSPR